MLFANTLHNPEDPSTASDIELMDLVISVLSPMIGHTGAFNAAASLRLFHELRNVAKKFFESSHREHNRKTKREYDSDLPKNDGSQSVTVAQHPTPPSTTQDNPNQSFMVSESHDIESTSLTMRIFRLIKEIPAIYRTTSPGQHATILSTSIQRIWGWLLPTRNSNDACWWHGISYPWIWRIHVFRKFWVGSREPVESRLQSWFSSGVEKLPSNLFANSHLRPPAKVLIALGATTMAWKTMLMKNYEYWPLEKQ
jgi:hypothetical protein